jgi:hypothetical protein
MYVCTYVKVVYMLKSKLMYSGLSDSVSFSDNILLDNVLLSDNGI